MKPMLPFSVYLWRFTLFRWLLIVLCSRIGPRLGNELADRTPLKQALRRYYWNNSCKPYIITPALSDNETFTGPQ